MSDEIRTPLNGIIDLSDSLGTEHLSDSQKKSVDVILQSSRALLAIIDDILGTPQAEERTPSIEKVDVQNKGFNLKSLLEQSLALFKAETLNRPVAMNLEFGGNIPSGIQGDAMQVRQIVINLLGNALKFTEKGTITLSADYDYMTGLVSIEVSDTGRGISQHRIGNIFADRQTQDNAFNPQYRGKGQGLVTCKQLVELMGGNIDVHSIEGQGSTFCVRFPVRR